MGATHGWSKLDAAAKRELIRHIRRGTATRGPLHLELDVTDRCNVACYFCNQQDVRSSDQLSIGHLRALIDELASTGLRSVRLSGGGDPLFHSDMGEILDHLETRGIVVDNVTTNALRLDAGISARLVQASARELIVSLNAVDERDYHRMMQAQPATFHRVVANVRKLVEIRGSGRFPELVVQFLIDRRNYGALPRMYDLGADLRADRIVIAPVSAIPLNRLREGELLRDSDAEMLWPLFEQILRSDLRDRRLQIHFPFHAWNAMVAAIKKSIGYADQVQFPLAPSFTDDNGHCFFSWYTASIKGDGDVFPCCQLMVPGYPTLGNVARQGFAGVWHGPSFRQFRLEQREVLLDGANARSQPDRYVFAKPQCIEPGACWLKNVYFRSDESFYRELGGALDKARARRRRLRPLRRLRDRARTTLRRVVGALRESS